MNSKEILNKAKFIQFPAENKFYTEYNLNDIHKLPTVNYNVLYNLMPTNKHHYTTHYHYKYVLQLINELFNFGFDMNDFNLIDYQTKYGDLSYLKPKQDFEFKVFCFTDNIEETLQYEDLKPLNNENISYIDLFRYPHKCSRIINLNIDNNKKIFISGDSQVIPDIPILACYYKEVWYFDNRTGKSEDWLSIDKNKTIKFSNTFEDVYFDDVLIELYTNPLWWYTDINLM